MCCITVVTLNLQIDEPEKTLVKGLTIFFCGNFWTCGRILRSAYSDYSGVSIFSKIMLLPNEKVSFNY